MIYEDCSVKGYEFGDFVVLGRSPEHHTKMVIQCKKCKSLYEITLHNTCTIKDLKGICKNCQNKEYVESLLNKTFGNIKVLKFIPNKDLKFYTDCNLETECINCGKKTIVTLKYFKEYLSKKRHSRTNKYCKDCYINKDKTADILKSKADTKHIKWDLPRNITFAKQTNSLRAYVRFKGKQITKDFIELKNAMRFVADTKLKCGIWSKEEASIYLSTYTKYKNISLGNDHLFKIRQKRKNERKNIEKTKRVIKHQLFKHRIIHLFEKSSKEFVYSLNQKELENLYIKTYKPKEIDCKNFQQRLYTFLTGANKETFTKLDTRPLEFGLAKYSQNIIKKSKHIFLDGQEFKTQREVADFLKISKQRVSQIVSKYGHYLITDENGKIRN